MEKEEQMEGEGGKKEEEGKEQGREGRKRMHPDSTFPSLLPPQRNLRTPVPALDNLASSSRGSAVHPPHRTCLLLWVPCPDPDASTSASAGQNSDKSPVQLASV